MWIVFAVDSTLEPTAIVPALIFDTCWANMACQEIRARNTPSMYQQVAENLRLEHEDHYQFSQDIPILDIAKGDVLICVQVNSVHVDIRNKPEEEIDPLITKALDENFIVFRVIKRSHKDAERLLSFERVSHIH